MLNSCQSLYLQTTETPPINIIPPPNYVTKGPMVSAVCCILNPCLQYVGVLFVGVVGRGGVGLLLLVNCLCSAFHHHYL